MVLKNSTTEFHITLTEACYMIPQSDSLLYWRLSMMKHIY